MVAYFCHQFSDDYVDLSDFICGLVRSYITTCQNYMSIGARLEADSV